MKKTNKSVIVAFAVNKGGTGKTTTVINTSAGLAQLGYKVLVIDIDQQANLTNTFLGEPLRKSLYDSIMDESVPLPIVEVRDNVSIVPASAEMYGISEQMILRSQKTQSDYRQTLSKLLNAIRDEYDFVLIDCPPSDNAMMVNALYAADTVVIVVKPEAFAMAGCHQMCDIIRAVRRHKPLTLTGVVFCDVDMYSPAHLSVIRTIRDQGPNHVFDTLIRHSRHLYNAASGHKDIFSHAALSNGGQDYLAFCHEFLKKIKK